MIFFPFEELTDRLKGQALNFVKKYELISVQLSSAIRKNSASLYVVFNGDIKGDKIWGVVVLSKTVLHCLPFAEKKRSSFSAGFAKKSEWQDYECLTFTRDLTDFYRSEKLALPECVNGVESGTSLILQSLENLDAFPRVINRYIFMRLNVKDFLSLELQAFSNGESFVRCKKDLPEPLLQSLIELQKKYELEEVLPRGFEFNEDSSRLKLKASLRRQYILAIDDGNGNLISKAQTNAIGTKCAQIGGVFTLPEQRGIHYARRCVLVLTKKILHARKLPVLYVKKENKAAQNLYKSLCYIPLTDYTICYF
ncbi:MAG: GNAT family N-acetyltransferase [Treponema sp.]|nr:GNAT family N-acetyltransferase [Treponema sp.]